MRASEGGVARFGALEDRAYTACGVAITRPVADMGAMLELIARSGATLAATCAAVPAAATAAELGVAP